MKIDDLSPHLNQANTLDNTVRRPVEEENKSTPKASEKIDQPGAKVDLSDTSVEFSRAAEEMGKVPEERIKKIEDLKNEVKNDTYNVDSVKIAEKLVDEVLSNIT